MSYHTINLNLSHLKPFSITHIVVQSDGSALLIPTVSTHPFQGSVKDGHHG